MKCEDINALVNRSWTEEELQTKLKRSGALAFRTLPLERTRINNGIAEAEKAGDEERVAKLRLELEQLEGPKLAHGTSMQHIPMKPVAAANKSQQERLAEVNKENRRKNAQQIRQAQVNERRAAKMTEAALARGEVVTEDHSRRVKTRAKFKHDVADEGRGKKDSDVSGVNTPTVGTPSLQAKKVSTLPHLVKLQNGDKRGFPTIHRPVLDDDIIGAIDLGIDIDIEL